MLGSNDNMAILYILDFTCHVTLFPIKFWGAQYSVKDCYSKRMNTILALSPSLAGHFGVTKHLTCITFAPQVNPVKEIIIPTSQMIIQRFRRS